VPLDIPAFGALQGVVLAAEDRHTVVAANIHQRHLGATRQAMHRTLSLGNSGRSLMPCHMHH
jgi:hypothetical protein